jgi:hypothetical protein
MNLKMFEEYFENKHKLNSHLKGHLWLIIFWFQTSYLIQIVGLLYYF